MRDRVIRALGGFTAAEVAPLRDACEFYAERTAANMRGSTGRWAPGKHPAPQPHRSASGAPSMWDHGSIARWALDATSRAKDEPA